MELHLTLTRACNLACAYCYQNARRPPFRMEPATAEKAIPTVLAAGEPPHRVVVSGGEPFLVRGLVERVIRLVADARTRWGPVECAVLTNGTLVTDADLDLLAEDDVELAVSFDGVESVQARRAPGSFVRLDHLLDRAFARRPRWARRRLSIAMMLPGAVVPSLAESVRYLTDKGIAEVGVEPLATHDAGWTASTREHLVEQVDEVVRDGLRRWKRTGGIPVAFLRAGSRSRGDVPPGAGPSPFVCAAPSGRNVAVDADGRAWGCPSFLPSVQHLPPLGEEAAAGLALGNVKDSQFPDRLAALARRAGLVRLLMDKEWRRSRRGPCRDCPHAAECFVCPAATAFIPGNVDPHRIPDNQCDFQWTTLEARRLFQDTIADSPLFWMREGGIWALLRPPDRRRGRREPGPDRSP